MSGKLRYFAISDVGCRRENNEDMAYAAGQIVRDGRDEGEVELPRPSMAIGESGPLGSIPVGFAVADGMGGYEGGEVASEIVIRSFGNFVKKRQGTGDAENIATLKRWADDANQLVYETAELRPELKDMGTTFVGLVFGVRKAMLINAGDSRCYRLRHGILKQLSTDHSERERRGGDMSVPGNIIYNAMGDKEGDFFSDVTVLQPLEGDLYLLCSDGLSDLVGDDDIEAWAEDPERLVEMAKEAGGKDNVTIVTIKLI